MRRWAFILIILCTLLGFIILMFIRRDNPFGKSNSRFTIDWIDDITTVKISEGKEDLLLDWSEEGWIVNNDFIARKSAIDFLISTLTRIEIKSPVSSELFNQLVTDKEIEPTLVTVCGRARKELVFFVYKSTDPGYGSIMKRGLRSKPFFVDLPGYNFDPGAHFISDEKFWMPYNIFNLHPESIESINVTYKDTTQSGFAINLLHNSSYFSIDGIHNESVDTAKLKRYISYYTYVPFENWVFDMDPELKANILGSEPEIRINLILKQRIEIELKLWIKFSNSGGDLIPDTDRLYGKLNSSDEIFVVKYFDVDPLIKTAEYFIMD